MTGGTSGKGPTCQCRLDIEMRVQPLGQEDPLIRAQQPTPVFLPGESHAQRSLAGTVHWVAHNRTLLSMHTCARAHTHKHTPNM